MDNAPKNPKSILFVCNQNSVRSPMAYGLAEAYCKRRIYVDSAGLIAGPLDGFSVAALGELDIDISEHESKTLKDIKVKDFDLIVALTTQTYERLLTMLQGTDVALEFWPTSDPCKIEGKREEILDGFRKVRDKLRTQIRARVKFD